MAKYHVSTDGNPRVCTASDGNCPIGGDDTHYTSKEAARAAFEALLEASDSSFKKTRFGGSVRKVGRDGGVEWRNAKGKLHRDDDLPAVEWSDGTKCWYQNGKLHRDGDQPAIEGASGRKEWYQNGKCHRDGDRPAIECPDGSKYWYQKNKRSRDDGLPAAERADGTKEWWFNGKFQYRVLPDGTRTEKR